MNIPARQSDKRERTKRWRIALLSLALAIIAFLPYAQTFKHDFINYDDNVFVTDNPQVRSGLTWASCQWALTTFHEGNWIPITWMSHMLDVSLFGMDPGWHHLVNVLLHSLSTALLFLAFFRMTGAVWKSAFVAALFGVHPLHVESVAWVTERKDVLSGLFFMLVLLSYERYVRREGTGRYLLVVLFFALGLLSKSMLVTAPFVLVLLDVWPLERTSLARPADGSPGRPVPWGRLLLEKTPLFLLSAGMSVITFAAQRERGAMALMERELLPWGDRLANAVVSYAVYAEKLFWPSSLAIPYLHPRGALSSGAVIGSAAFLAALLSLVLWQRRVRPYLPVGLFWYLGMLLPVIGLVQVGVQAMADRYTYLPLIGLSIMLAWSAGDLMAVAGKHRKRVLMFSGGAAVVSFLAVTAVQVGHWQDTVTLFQHTVLIAPDNRIAHRLLANALSDKGRTEESIVHYREVLRIQPRNAFVHNSLGVELARIGQRVEAIEHYREALRIKPDLAEACNNLGNALALTGRNNEAVDQYREAIRLRPQWSVPRENLERLQGKGKQLFRDDRPGRAKN